MSLPTLKQSSTFLAGPRPEDSVLNISFYNFYMFFFCIVGAICGAICHSLDQGSVAGDVWTLITATFACYMALQCGIWRSLRYRLDWTPAEVDPSDPDYQRCYRLLELAAQRLGLPTPIFILYDEKFANACAKWIEGNMAVGVTMGMLDTHTDAELLATLGHEMAHHANGDTQSSPLHDAIWHEVQGSAEVLNLLLLGETLLLPIFALNSASLMNFFLFLPILVYFLNGLFAAYQLAAIYRRQEYAADIGAMQAQPHLYVNKEALVNLRSHKQLVPPQNWQQKTGYWLYFFFGGYASTHPLIWQRLQNLERHAANIAADS